MKNQLLIIFLSFLFSFSYSSNLNAQCCDNSETEKCCSKTSCSANHQHGIAPIGIMGDHCHPKRGLMLSYRYMNMTMEGNRAGADNSSDETVFQSYMMAPQKMQMGMHMMGLMYGLSDQVTLMAMMNYQKNEMNMLTMDGREHQHSSSGIGDLKLTAIANIWKSKNQSVHFNIGLSLPTGDIDMTEENHMNHEAGGSHISVMPYPMRLGSGTYDALLGATYTLSKEKLTIGLQANSVLRMQDNSRDYRLGNQLNMNIWLAYRFNNILSASLRGEAIFIQEMKGMDEELPMMMSPTNDYMNSGSERYTTHLALNVSIPNFLNGLQIGIEFGLPVYQSVNGIQMDHQNVLTIGAKGNIL